MGLRFTTRKQMTKYFLQMHFEKYLSSSDNQLSPEITCIISPVLSSSKCIYFRINIINISHRDTHYLIQPNVGRLYYLQNVCPVFFREFSMQILRLSCHFRITSRLKWYSNWLSIGKETEVNEIHISFWILINHSIYFI